MRMLSRQRAATARSSRLLLTVVAALCLNLHTVFVSARSEYLYNIMPDKGYEPVVDYEPPEDESTKNNMGGSELEEPSFLYSTTGPGAVARVVEFYAPWCPHCKHFAPKYVQLAKKMKESIKPYGIALDFYAVSCTANKNVCKKQDIHGYPTLKIFPAGKINGTKANYYDLHPFQVLREIGIQVEKVDLSEEESDNQAEGEKVKRHLTTSKASDNNKKDEQFRPALSEASKRTKADIYGDAYRSFHFAMKTGIYMANGPLDEKLVPILKGWLELLESTLPPTWSIQNLIRKLLGEFEEICKGEDEMVAVLDQFPPDSKEWTSFCTHGEEAMGYTCGLWELFHIMTIGVVEYNEQVVSDDGYSFYRTEEVAEQLRNYIANFFGCEICRMHFLNAYDTCALDRCNRLSDKKGDLADWKQLPIWLFETHNAVNVRLMKEQAERDSRTPTHQDEINVQWPSRIDCPKCWKPDGSWNEELVYLYLYDQYWPDNGGGSKVSRRALFQENLVIEQDDEDEQSSFIFTIFKYCLIIGLVAVTGIFVKKKTDIMKTGRHKKWDN